MTSCLVTSSIYIHPSVRLLVIQSSNRSRTYNGAIIQKGSVQNQVMVKTENASRLSTEFLSR